MEPTLASILICRKAYPAPDGAMVAERIITGLDFETLPADVELSIVLQILDAPRPLPVTIRFYAAVGEHMEYSVYAFDSSLPHGEATDVANLAHAAGFHFTEPKRYRVRVFANGVDIGGTYFRVGMRSRLN